MKINDVVKRQIAIQIRLIRILFPPLEIDPYSGLPFAYATSEFWEKHELASPVVNVYPVKSQKKELFKYYTTFLIIEENYSLGSNVMVQSPEDCIGIPDKWFEENKFETISVKGYIKALIDANLKPLTKTLNKWIPWQREYTRST